MQDDQLNQNQWTYPQTEEPFIQNEPSQFIPDAPSTADSAGRPAKKKTFGYAKVIALALSFSLLGGALGSAGAWWILHQTDSASGLAQSENGNSSVIHIGDRNSSTIEINKIDTSKVMTPAEVYAANVNSTVGITTSINTNFFGYPTTAAASGSGFILSEDGYILTNQHVIEDSSSITVSFYDGSSLDAQLVGYDASNDIAVLKVDAQGLTPVILGDSDNLNVGDSVVAIGNPLGELTFSLTTGAISAMERDITISTGSTMRLLQTDCAINSGNSGGPLFNLYGEVIGITNAKYSGSGSSTEASIDNIAFAIPVNNVMDIVQSIIEKGYVSKPYIGITVSDVSAESQSYGLPQGAAVRSVLEDSPAEESGLQTNDIITHVDGKQILSSSELVSLVADHEIGDKLELTVYRKGKTVEIRITISEQKSSATGESSANESSQSGSRTSPPWGYGY